MKKWPYNKLTTIFLMIPLVSLYSFSLDLYIPLLPNIQKFFVTSMSSMQLSNSLFMLGCGLGQLAFGPISDYFGRRKVLLTALAIYLTATLTALSTTNIHLFIAARILQALGACGSYLCCFASIRDIFSDENDSAEMYSYLNIANSISAICAPTIGSVLTRNHSWHATFLCLLAIAIVALLSAFMQYTETAPNIKKAHKHQRIIAAI